MFGEALGSIGGASAGGVGLGGMMGLSAATTAYNIYQQERQYKYEKGLQNKIFNREDNAVQRRVADLQAAGLSPVLAAGQAASAGSTISVDTPRADDLAGKWAGLIQMKQNIAQSNAQVELLKQQKDLAYAQELGAYGGLNVQVAQELKLKADAWKASVEAAKNQRDLDILRKTPGDMLSDSPGVTKTGAYLNSIIMDLTNKTGQAASATWKSYDSFVQDINAELYRKRIKITDDVKKDIKKAWERIKKDDSENIYPYPYGG